jgi:hypothetical protein
MENFEKLFTYFNGFVCPAERKKRRMRQIAAKQCNKESAQDGQTPDNIKTARARRWPRGAIDEMNGRPVLLLGVFILGLLNQYLLLLHLAGLFVHMVGLQDRGGGFKGKDKIAGRRVSGEVYILFRRVGRAVRVGMEVAQEVKVERAHVLHSGLLLFGCEGEMDAALLGVVERIHLFYNFAALFNASCDEAAGFKRIANPGIVDNNVD